jgi:beta-glucosidase
MDPKLAPNQRAELVLKQMTLDEKITLLHGNGMPGVPMWQMPLTHLANGGAGYVEGIERLGIPPIYMSDAAYGVRSSATNGRYSTALPANVAAASSWDIDSACAYGELIGRELRAQGYNMTLGGGVNLIREPRNGRTFEYLGEDPLLAGTLAGHRIRCEQAQHVIGDLKHYALNDQETGRFYVNAVIGKRAMQESDLLAFHIALDLGHPGAVMCSYNRINGDFGCENSYTLRDVLKRDWGFQGFVLSDWSGTRSTEKASAAGLDQEQPMADYFGPKLKQAVEAGRVPLSEIDDHVRRVLYAEFLSGMVDNPPQKSVVDAEHGLEVARQIEEKSIVLLKNSGGVLPIDPARVRSIAVIGGHADVGMVSGGGSAQVDPPVGNAVVPPAKTAADWQDRVWFPTSPLKALRSKLPGVRIDFDSGIDPKAAAQLAKSADLAIIVAARWQAEGMDLPNLSLPGNQDELIAAVAAVNPRTVVVLETGAAVTMPWLDKVAGVVETWFAGSAGHKALANILSGEVNPSGKLAITFPRSVDDLPHPGQLQEPANAHNPTPETFKPGDAAYDFTVRYDEGPLVGYKWYEVRHKQPLFAFGYGLSYTTYAYFGLTVDSATRVARLTVKNTGSQEGEEIVELYGRQPEGSDEPFQRLVGFTRVSLAAGQSKTVEITIDTRVLAAFDEANNRWNLAPGDYQILAGPSSDNTPLTASLSIR